MRPGVFSVGDQGNTTNSPHQLYNTTYSGDCRTIRLPNGNIGGFGIIRPGDSPGCVVTKTLIYYLGPPAPGGGPCPCSCPGPPLLPNMLA